MGVAPPGSSVIGAAKLIRTRRRKRLFSGHSAAPEHKQIVTKHPRNPWWMRRGLLPVLGEELEEPPDVISDVLRWSVVWVHCRKPGADVAAELQNEDLATSSGVSLHYVRKPR